LEVERDYADEISEIDISLTVLWRSFAERPVIIMNGSQEVRINCAVRSTVLPASTPFV
jgi:hypothetical protein